MQGGDRQLRLRVQTERHHTAAEGQKAQGPGGDMCPAERAGPISSRSQNPPPFPQRLTPAVHPLPHTQYDFWLVYHYAMSHLLSPTLLGWVKTLMSYKEEKKSIKKKNIK